MFKQQRSFPTSKGVDHWHIRRMMQRMLTGAEIPDQSQTWWQWEKDWRCKVYTKHDQDATSLELMSKREICEKLINNRLEREIGEGYLGEMRNLSASSYKDTKKGCNN